MTAGAIRVYADTSVYGGAFDEEFMEPTRRFFSQVREGRLVLVSSPVVRREVGRAPDEVRALFNDMTPLIEFVEASEEALRLRRAYLDQGIVSPRRADDALHVAVATVARCSAIVSWNFRHIVHSRKIPLYNAVNAVRGHAAIAIHSPREVIEYEEEV